MKFECSTLILDLDGTISDPSLGIIRCFNHALESYGLAPLTDDIIRNEIGPPLDETFLKLAQGIGREDVVKLISIYRERYSDVGYSENTLYPAIGAALGELTEAGIDLGVCTSKRSDFAEKILSLFGLSGYFGFVSGGDIGISKGDQLRALLENHEIDHKAIMVGDRSVDINSARQNDLRAFGVLWGFGGYSEISDAFPVCIVKEVKDLPKLVF